MFLLLKLKLKDMIKSMIPKNKVIPFIPYYYIKASQLHDNQINSLKTVYGSNGFAVYDFIINEIFRTGSCSLPWCADTICKVADYWELTPEEVEKIVEHCIKVDLFSAELYTKYHILTSTDIKQRYNESSFIQLAANL